MVVQISFILFSAVRVNFFVRYAQFKTINTWEKEFINYRNYRN